MTCCIRAEVPVIHSAVQQGYMLQVFAACALLQRLEVFDGA